MPAKQHAALPISSLPFTCGVCAVLKKVCRAAVLSENLLETSFQEEVMCSSCESSDRVTQQAVKLPRIFQIGEMGLHTHTRIILNIVTKRERSHEGRVHLKFLLNSMQALCVWPRPNAPRLSRLPSPLFIW